MTILSVLPMSWSVKKVQVEFGFSNYTARAVQKLFSEKGILSTHNPKPWRALNKNLTELVKYFYNFDDISRMMPGKRIVPQLKKKKGRPRKKRY